MTDATNGYPPAAPHPSDTLHVNGSSRPASLRQAVREDLAEGRQWVQTRAERAQDAIRDEPIRTTLYALGVGLLIGLLIRR